MVRKIRTFFLYCHANPNTLFLHQPECNTSVLLRCNTFVCRPSRRWLTEVYTTRMRPGAPDSLGAYNDLPERLDTPQTVLVRPGGIDRLGVGIRVKNISGKWLPSVSDSV